MRKATLPLVWLVLLGTSSWAGTAAAQTDETAADGDPAGQESPAAGQESPAGGETAPATDAAPDDGAPEDGAAASSDGASPDAATSEGSAGGSDDASSEPASDAASSTQLSAPSSSSDDSVLEEGDLEEEQTADGESGEAAEEEAAEEEPSGPPPLPWRNTFFTWTHQVTMNSFVRDGQLSYDPTYYQSFYLSPRWYLTPTSYFIVNQGLNIEITDSDGYALNHDPQVGDTNVQFRQMVPWEGFVFLGIANVYIPISKSSQAVHRYLGAGLGLTVVRPISEAGLTLAALFNYTRYIAGSNVTQVGGPTGNSCPAGPGSQFGTSGGMPLNSVMCDQIGGPTAGRDLFYAGLSVTETIENFSISATFLFYNIYGFELAPATIQVDNLAQPLQIADGSPTHWRNYTYFSLQAAYQFLPWFNLALGIQNSYSVASAYNPDGSIRNPIFSPDTQVYLQATVQLDEIYTEVSGAGEEDLTPQERQRRRQGLASGPRVGGAF